MFIGNMDLHNALAALIRPVAIPGMLPFQSQLLSLAHMDTSHLLNMPAIPELTLTPKKVSHVVKHVY